MKPRTLAKLDMLAAEQETQQLDAIRRASATLKQTEHQRGVLEAYRVRLAGSWQDGAVLEAGQARRAGQFIAASHSAQAQIDAAAERAQQHLEIAVANLSQTRLRRRTLADMLRRGEVLAEREAEQRLERETQWRPDPARRSPA
ncbi:MAG: hypothetical protein B7X08_01335 [Acidocella sp. 20-63-7]|nr:MAG: hypothetical protein B7X08_01335 [Acidocella sp. 20-63-7]HQT46410.1 hypothetical protein [Acidocella sp.]